jgi:hypothetical protein
VDKSRGYLNSALTKLVGHKCQIPAQCFQILISAFSRFIHAFSVILTRFDRQIEQLKRCEPISEAEVKQLCLQAREILVEEGNVQYVDSPVTVCDLTFDPFLIIVVMVEVCTGT